MRPAASQPSPDLQRALAEAELQLSAVSQALLLGQPDLVQEASADLHRAAQRLAALLEEHPAAATQEPSVRGRLAGFAQSMAVVREACVRRLAVAERSLHSLLPSTRPATYGGAVAGYGRSGTQNAAFRPFS